MEFKFRAWDTVRKCIWQWDMVNRDIDLGNILKGKSTLIPLQYTGERDIEGTEMYLGDIVRFDFSGELRVGVIEFKKGQFTISINQKLGNQKIGHSFSHASSRNHVVLGSKYSNPELLELITN